MANLSVPDAERLFHFGGHLGDSGTARPATTPFVHPHGGARDGERVLVTGIAGGQGRLIATELLGRFAVTGVDRDPWPGHPREIDLHLLDLRKRKFEDIFRTVRPDTVVHHAFVRHFRGDPELRHEVNVLGTQRLLDFAAASGVKRIVVLSSGYVYGALPENPTFIDEEAPLNVSRTYPEVRDLAEVDHLVTTFLWQHPEIATTILRPVNVLGATSHSAIARFLRAPLVPMMMGFDPMMQFIHERDVARAVVQAIDVGTHGVFNVTGSGAVPLSVAVRETGGIAIPFPEPLARLLFEQLFRFGLYHTPAVAIDFLKYVCTLDGRRFRHVTGFAPQHSLRETFAAVRG
jgi:UDP-glucose 4-epimerase